VICPYCHSAYQAEAGDYSEEVREEKCQNCRHTFIRWDEFEVTYYTKKKK
jgi:transposase-like protein